MTKNYFATKDKVIEYFKKYKKVLVLDDSHYVPSKIQYDIACQLKEVIRLGFKAVVISLPYRSDDAIRLNPDLTDRISMIEMEPWKEEELERIVDMGFAQLGLQISGEMIARMAKESIHSPQLMQSICLNLGLISKDSAAITDGMVRESCKFTCMNLPYGDVVRILIDVNHLSNKKAVAPQRFIYLRSNCSLYLVTCQLHYSVTTSAL